MDNVKEFGNITVPTSWNEITLKMFQDLQRFYSENENYNMRDIVRIFTDMTDDELNELPMEFLETILLHLSFLNIEPEEKEATNKIVINGDEYIVNTMEKLKFGEWVDTQTVMKDDKHNLAGILGIICRKKGELYDSEFIAEKYEERVKMFENVPITDILPIVAFFFRLLIISETPSVLYSLAEDQIAHILHHIDNLKKDGGGRTSSIRSARKALRKLEKQLKNTLQT